jgi:glycosyltransferase involved in cell wall biosynthesis
VDDACPDKSGDFIERQITDPRVIVIRHTHNQGVGAAVLTGYHAALKNNDDIIVKIDGDGQMDPGFISKLVEPILSLDADYTKANRFYNLEFIQSMPIIRKIGNALLSFMNKFSTGYWDIFDPTNGFTAIHAKVLRELNFNKIAKGYFFETDLLFRLNIIRAVVRDIPCKAHYGNEKSQLKIKPVIAEFMWGHCRNFFKRILYNYFLRNFTIGSLEILFALILVPTGILKGLYEWHLSGITGEPVSAGAVMLSALPVILGFQFLFVFFNQDIQSVPRTVLHPYLKTNEEK